MEEPWRIAAVDVGRRCTWEGTERGRALACLPHPPPRPQCPSKTERTETAFPSLSQFTEKNCCQPSSSSAGPRLLRVRHAVVAMAAKGVLAHPSFLFMSSIPSVFSEATLCQGLCQSQTHRGTGTLPGPKRARRRLATRLHTDRTRTRTHSHTLDP